MADENLFHVEPDTEIEPARSISSFWAWMFILIAAVFTFVFAYDTYNEELTSSILSASYVHKSADDKDVRRLEEELRSVPLQDLGKELDNIQQIIVQ